MLADKVRNALRISTSSAVIMEDIKNCIDACKKDLKLAGIVRMPSSDPYIVRAVILYTKAEFDFSGKGEKFRESYESMKLSLALSGEYSMPRR